ncbi:hypothetical protein QJQ45_028601 [Haematococcus lacustris]|nr:hypothetical protein QJQ45_028601 [Haematococcus lacustris]
MVPQRTVEEELQIMEDEAAGCGTVHSHRHPPHMVFPREGEVFELMRTMNGGGSHAPSSHLLQDAPTSSQEGPITTQMALYHRSSQLGDVSDDPTEVRSGTVGGDATAGLVANPPSSTAHPTQPASQQPMHGSIVDGQPFNLHIGWSYMPPGLFQSHSSASAFSPAGPTPGAAPFIPLCPSLPAPQMSVQAMPLSPPSLLPLLLPLPGGSAQGGQLAVGVSAYQAPLQQPTPCQQQPQHPPQHPHVQLQQQLQSQQQVHLPQPRAQHPQQQQQQQQEHPQQQQQQQEHSQQQQHTQQEQQHVAQHVQPRDEPGCGQASMGQQGQGQALPGPSCSPGRPAFGGPSSLPGGKWCSVNGQAGQGAGLGQPAQAHTAGPGGQQGEQAPGQQGTGAGPPHTSCPGLPDSQWMAVQQQQGRQQEQQEQQQQLLQGHAQGPQQLQLLQQVAPGQGQQQLWPGEGQQQPGQQGQGPGQAPVDPNSVVDGLPLSDFAAQWQLMAQRQQMHMAWVWQQMAMAQMMAAQASWGQLGLGALGNPQGAMASMQGFGGGMAMLGGPTPSPMLPGLPGMPPMQQLPWGVPGMLGMGAPMIGPMHTTLGSAPDGMMGSMGPMMLPGMQLDSMQAGMQAYMPSMLEPSALALPSPPTLPYLGSLGSHPPDLPAPMLTGLPALDQAGFAALDANTQLLSAGNYSGLGGLQLLASPQGLQGLGLPAADPTFPDSHMDMAGMDTSMQFMGSPHGGTAGSPPSPEASIQGGGLDSTSDMYEGEGLQAGRRSPGGAGEGGARASAASRRGSSKRGVGGAGLGPGAGGPQAGGAGGGQAGGVSEGRRVNAAALKREMALQSSSSAPGPPDTKRGRRLVAKEVKASSENKICKNCGTKTTPFWRKDRHDGKPLCNACGLYYSKNDAPRPKALWKAEEGCQMDGQEGDFGNGPTPASTMGGLHGHASMHGGRLAMHPGGHFLGAGGVGGGGGGGGGGNAMVAAVAAATAALSQAGGPPPPMLLAQVLQLAAAENPAVGQALHAAGLPAFKLPGLATAANGAAGKGQAGAAAGAPTPTAAPAPAPGMTLGPSPGSCGAAAGGGGEPPAGPGGEGGPQGVGPGGGAAAGTVAGAGGGGQPAVSNGTAGKPSAAGSCLEAEGTAASDEAAAAAASQVSNGIPSAPTHPAPSLQPQPSLAPQPAQGPGTAPAPAALAPPAPGGALPAPGPVLPPTLAAATAAVTQAVLKWLANNQAARMAQLAHAAHAATGGMGGGPMGPGGAGWPGAPGAGINRLGVGALGGGGAGRGGGQLRPGTAAGGGVGLGLGPGPGMAPHHLMNILATAVAATGAAPGSSAAAAAAKAAAAAVVKLPQHLLASASLPAARARGPGGTGEGKAGAGGTSADPGQLLSDCICRHITQLAGQATL